MSHANSNPTFGRSLRAPALLTQVGEPDPIYPSEGPGVATASGGCFGGCAGCCGGCCLGFVLLFVTVGSFLFWALRAYLRRTAIGNDFAEQGKKGGRLLVEYLERKADAEEEERRR